jgi:hypothetical protein
LVLRDATGGIVDHVKLLGRFGVAGDEQHPYRITGCPPGVEPGSWTEQGYPFLSGRGAYRTTFEVHEEHEGKGLHLEVPMHDDVLEVEINGESAGVRLWDPYLFDISRLVRGGRIEVVLRVANTLANLLYGVTRPSGLGGAPRLLTADDKAQGKE